MKTLLFVVATSFLVAFAMAPFALGQDANGPAADTGPAAAPAANGAEVERTFRESAAITLIFALFWGTAISGMKSCGVFNIWMNTNVLQCIGRLIVGVMILNFLPMVLLLLVFEAVPNDVTDRQTLACAGVASLSVFSVVFLLPAVLQMGFGNVLYGQANWTSEATKAEVPTNGWLPSFLVGVCYIVVPLLFSAKLTAPLVSLLEGWFGFAP